MNEARETRCVWLRASLWLAGITAVGSVATLILVMRSGRLADAWVVMVPATIGAAKAGSAGRARAPRAVSAGTRLAFGLYLGSFASVLAGAIHLRLGWIYDPRLTVSLLMTAGLASGWYFLAHRNAAR